MTKQRLAELKDLDIDKGITIDKYSTEDVEMYMKPKLIIKARKMPIGTISHGRKKVAEGKWVPIPKGRRKKTLASEHDIQQIRDMFKRREPGKGGPQEISSQHDLDLILKQTTFCMLSAGRNTEIESDRKLSDVQINLRDKDLKDDLVKLGHVYTSARGKYGALEEGILVMAHEANLKEMVALGTKYNQDSVLFVSNGHSDLIQTTGDRKGETNMSGDGHTYVPKAEDFYTEMNVGSKKVKFTMNLAEIAKSIVRLVIGLFK